MKFAIFGNTYQAKKSAHIKELFSILEQYNAEIAINKEFYDFLNTEMQLPLQDIEVISNINFTADIVISIGGDGTFLQTANMVREKQIPILGINTGRLGFLADITPDEIGETFKEIHNNCYQIEERTMLHLQANGKDIIPDPYALNEIAVLKRDSSSMITIHTSINDEYLTTYQADGLIIATPTGSTAYSLSVGGPIIVPNSHTIGITPVAPHSFNVRPFVICDDLSITLEVESRNHNFLIAVDGRSEPCKEKTKLTIKKADFALKVVKRKEHSFIETLRKKLMWGADSRI